MLAFILVSKGLPYSTLIIPFKTAFLTKISELNSHLIKEYLSIRILVNYYLTYITPFTITHVGIIIL